MPEVKILFLGYWGWLASRFVAAAVALIGGLKMDVGTERLIALRVSDVMSREVITVPMYQDLSEVASVFTTNKISAAPVVNDHGVCVGMISASDYVLNAQSGKDVWQSLAMQEHALRPQADSPNAPLEISPIEPMTAAHVMSHGVQTVDGGASLVVAARMMCQAHLHHLPVVDSAGTPVGILSTLDVVSAMVHSVEEMKNALN